MTKIDIADLDVIFLTFDEPKKEEFWIHIRNQLPWAKRVDGIKGSDAAHKAAAAVSDTERFILIDGDNLPDWDFFNMTLEFPDSQWESAVFRWRSKNVINGLMYGNGGISSWTRTHVNLMRTHENSDGRSHTQVEFCFDSNYWPMHDCYSTTHVNGSAKQAWRAGFREGVKMCLDRGSKVNCTEFSDRIVLRNQQNLAVWCNVGADVENGIWAMAGARTGAAMTMLTDWTYQQVQDFDYLAELWESQSQQDPKDLCSKYEDQLQQILGIDMVDLSPKASAFFKKHQASNRHNRGIMVREIDLKHRIPTDV